jgi:hypothetical protein
MNEKHVLQDIFEEANFPCRSYSGRAMYGKECLGVTIERGQDVGMLFANIVDGLYELVAHDHEEDHHEQAFLDVADAMRAMRTDNMGLGTIVYFPGVEFVGDGDEEEEDEEPEDERA